MRHWIWGGPCRPRNLARFFAIALCSIYVTIALVHPPAFVPQSVRTYWRAPANWLSQRITDAYVYATGDKPAFETRFGIYLLIASGLVPWIVLRLSGRRLADIGTLVPNRFAWRIVLVGFVLAFPFLLWMVNSPSIAGSYVKQWSKLGPGFFLLYYFVNMLTEHFLLHGVVLGTCHATTRWPRDSAVHSAVCSSSEPEAQATGCKETKAAPAFESSESFQRMSKAGTLHVSAGDDHKGAVSTGHEGMEARRHEERKDENNEQRRDCIGAVVDPNRDREGAALHPSGLRNSECCEQSRDRKGAVPGANSNRRKANILARSLRWIGLGVDQSPGADRFARWLGLPAGCWPGIVCSGLLFGMIHFGKDGRELLLSFPGGMMEAFIAYRTGSWLTPFFLHAATAATAFGMMYATSQ